MAGWRGVLPATDNVAFAAGLAKSSPMKSTKRKSPARAKGFSGKNGYDLMGGPTIRTTPTCPPKYLHSVPQLGLNMGMDRRP